VHARQREVNVLGVGQADTEDVLDIVCEELLPLFLLAEGLLVGLPVLVFDRGFVAELLFEEADLEAQIPLLLLGAQIALNDESAFLQALVLLLRLVVLERRSPREFWNQSPGSDGRAEG